MKSLEVLRRLRERGYRGRKSAVYALARELRRQSTRPVCRYEGVAGEFSQHDFGAVRVRWTHGGRERVQFFASRLKNSRYVAVTLVESQQVEPLVRTLAEHFEAFGGVPLLAVFDRPGTVALKSDPRTGAVLEWNPVFAEALTRLGLAAEVGWPYRANQKGAVENPVGWVNGSFFKTRRFLDRQDLQLQLDAWHKEVNERRPSRATRRVPGELLRETERERLRPLKLRAADLDLRFAVRVGPTGLVTWRTNRHSMPAEALGFAATLRAYRDRVVIEAGRYRAGHPRLHGRDGVSSLPALRAGLLAAVSGRRGRMYLKRRQLLDLGPDAERVITELVHVRRRRWPDDIERLHELLQACGDAALRAAFKRAAGGGRPPPRLARLLLRSRVRHPRLQPHLHRPQRPPPRHPQDLPPARRPRRRQSRLPQRRPRRRQPALPCRQRPPCPPPLVLASARPAPPRRAPASAHRRTIPCNRNRTPQG